MVATPFACDHSGCDAAFSKRGNFVAHKRIHTGEKFRVDGELQLLPKKQREAELLAFIRAWEFPKEGGQSCFIKYMYYDMDGGVLGVHNDPGYHPLMRACAI